jgi:DNA-binding IclR family transcriptional regulator
MTKTKRALIWMEQGKPFKDMAADLGMTQKECRTLINNLMAWGYIQSVPIAYELTEKGQERSQYVPKSKPKTLAHQRMRHQMDKPEDTEKMVARARRMPNNFVFSQGAQV